MSTLNLPTVNFNTIVDDLLPVRGNLEVIFDNGEMALIPVRKMVIHLIFLEIARKWGVVITPDFIVDMNSVDTSSLSKLGTIILDAVRKIHRDYHAIVHDFAAAMNRLNRFTIDHCQEYHKALSILDIVHTAAIPEIRKITNDKVSDLSLPIKEIDKRVKANVRKLHAELRKPHPENKLFSFINLKFVKDLQLAHIFHQIGLRTDINDTIIRYPVTGNYLNGLKNVTEYCLEALSAKKSAFYNKDSLPSTEYFCRKQHILLSSIKHLYPGDCGTSVTNPMLITEKNKEMIMGKNIVEGHQIITLDKHNIDNYVGKICNLRTPLACRYRDGVCETCGGSLLSSITPGMHIGIFSAIQTTSVVTQVILSAKHVQSTNSIEYVVPEELKNILTKNIGNIYVRPKAAEKFADTTFVFNIKDAVNLTDLPNINLSRINSINESNFGTCKDLVILKTSTFTPITDCVCLTSNDQSPMYSRHFIKYIADNFDLVTIRDNLFMISMERYNFDHPIFKLQVQNNSMVKFVNDDKHFLESEVRKYTSATKILSDFTNLVWTQVRPNIVYLEVVLRAAMVSGRYDFRLPIVEDIENVKFCENTKLNMYRSIGNLAAFERLPRALEDPEFYISPKILTPFDKFLNLKPSVKI